MRTLKPVFVLVGLSAALLALGLLPQRQLLAAPSADTTFTVNTTDDRLDNHPDDGDCLTSVGTCSLRAAIMQANHFTEPGETTIILPAGTYTLTLNGAGGDDETGDLNLTAPLGANQKISLVGAGANVTVINANQTSRVLAVSQDRVATISGVTLRNGLSTGIFFNDGGGLQNGGSLTLRNVTISDSSAPTGGGISNDSQGNLTVINSTISGNSTPGDGAGIYNGNVLTIVNSTISGNHAEDDGGGIYNIASAQANVYNATIYANEANDNDAGGGVGGGVYNVATGIFNVRNALVANNYLSDGLTFDDCTGAVGLYGYNLIGLSAEGVSDCDFSGTGFLVFLNSTAYIGGLQDNGGSTWTHALLPGSNAIDFVTLVCIGPDSNLLSTDQRGSPRVGGRNCDIGAYEYIPPVFLPLVIR